jgi:hypothetical protein
LLGLPDHAHPVDRLGIHGPLFGGGIDRDRQSRQDTHDRHGHQEIEKCKTSTKINADWSHKTPDNNLFGTVKNLINTLPYRSKRRLL